MPVRHLTRASVERVRSKESITGLAGDCVDLQGSLGVGINLFIRNGSKNG